MKEGGRRGCWGDAMWQLNLLLLALKIGRVTSQGIWAATRHWRGQEKDPPLESPEGMQMWWHLEFSLVRPILNFWPLEVYDNKFVLFKLLMYFGTTAIIN